MPCASRKFFSEAFALEALMFTSIYPLLASMIQSYASLSLNNRISMAGAIFSYNMR